MRIIIDIPDEVLEAGNNDNEFHYIKHVAGQVLEGWDHGSVSIEQDGIKAIWWIEDEE